MKVEEPALRPPLVALMSHFDVGLGWVDSAQTAPMDNVLQLNDETDVDNGDNQLSDDEYLPRDDGSESEYDDKSLMVRSTIRTSATISRNSILRS